MPRRQHIALSMTFTISHPYGHCRPFKPLFHFHNNVPEGLCFSLSCCLRCSGCGKRRSFQPGPLVRLLQLCRDRGGAQTRTCFSFTNCKSRALSPQTELVRDRKEKYEEPWEMWHEKKLREIGFHYLCLLFAIELLKSEDSH